MLEWDSIGADDEARFDRPGGRLDPRTRPRPSIRMSRTCTPYSNSRRFPRRVEDAIQHRPPRRVERIDGIVDGDVVSSVL